MSTRPGDARPREGRSTAEKRAGPDGTGEWSAEGRTSGERQRRPGPMRTMLVDDRARPTFRERLGHALAGAAEADFAVARIRLAAIDLTDRETARVRRCRVLVGRLDAEALVRTGDQAPGGGAPAALRAFLDSGRLEVRAAGLEVWTPDFSILRGLRDAPHDALVVVGAHYFARPFTNGGPAFTCMLAGREAADRATRRFEELWRKGYDVADIVREALARLGR